MREMCQYILPGNHQPSPADLFERMALWCRDNEIEHDIYGEGQFIQASEQKVADLLGFEAGLFVITGTMAQPTMLQLACQTRHCHNVAMHETSHVYLRERQGYQMQNRFRILPVGNPYTPWQLNDLKTIPDELGAVLYELPMRELGGQLPPFEALEEIKEYCHERGIHLHMDGARLWESAAFYQKSYKEIARGFHSAYVSLYKGINGIGGALLLGDRRLIERARTWMKRQGGNVYHRTPYVVAAMMQFDQQIAKMPRYFERTQQLVDMLAECKHITPNPIRPQSNMLHLYFPKGAEQASQIRDRLAKEHGIWIGNPQQGQLESSSFVEWYIGDRLIELDDALLSDILGKIDTLMGE